MILIAVSFSILAASFLTLLIEILSQKYSTYLHLSDYDTCYILVLFTNLYQPAAIHFYHKFLFLFLKDLFYQKSKDSMNFNQSPDKIYSFIGTVLQSPFPSHKLYLRPRLLKQGIYCNIFRFQN